MPGTILLDDLHASIEDQLHQHVNDLLKQAQQVGQQAQQAVVQPVQAAAGMAQMPQQIQAPDAGQVQQALMQHVDTITQAAQPALQVLGGAQQAAGGALSTLGANADQVRQSLLDHVDSITQPAQSGLQSLAVPKPPTAALGAPPDQGQAPTLGGPSDQAITTPQTGQSLGPIDSSSASTFAKSFAPYAQYAAQKLGIDPSWVTAMAASESNYGKAAGNELFGIKALPGQAGTSMLTHEGEGGGTQMNQTFASYDSPLGAVDAYVNLLKNHYPGALNAPTLGDFVHGLKQGGYFTAGEGEYRDILQGISNRPDVQAGLQAAGNVVQAVGGAVQQAGRDISQFGDSQLTSSEAYAACGPAAAVRFAERFGRNPTLREATDLAKQVGWTEQGGMAGLQSEQKLMTNLGVDTRTVGRDWSAFAKEAATGNPVTISTPGHYFYADGYNAESGAFHVGRSGLDLKNGSEWMTPAQMENLMGTADGALFSNNPNVPTKGSLTTSNETAPNAPIGPPPAQPVKQPLYVHGTMQDAQGPTPIQTAADVLGGAAGAVGSAVGQVASDLGSAAQGAVQGAQQALQPAARAIEEANREALPVVQQAAQQVVQAATPVLGGVQQAVQGAAPVLGGVASDVGTAARGATDTAGQVLGGALGLSGTPEERQARSDQYQRDVEAAVEARRQQDAQPITPGRVLGDAWHMIIGDNPPMGISLQQYQDAQQSKNQWIEQNNPARDMTVVGGLTSGIAQQLTDPLMLATFGPSVGAGRVVGAAAGRGVTAAVGERLAPAAVRFASDVADKLASGAIIGGVQNALMEAEKPDATPQSVGQALLVGAGFGAAADVGSAALAPVVRRIGQGIIDRAPEIQTALRSRQPAQADVNAALGGIPAAVERVRGGGEAAPAPRPGEVSGARSVAGRQRLPNYDPNTPEGRFEAIARPLRESSPDGLLHLDLNTLPENVLPLDRNTPTSSATGLIRTNPGGAPHTDDLRALYEANTQKRDFYADQSDQGVPTVGPDNLEEWFALNAITSQQTNVTGQVSEAIKVMGMVRKIARDDRAAGLSDTEIKADILKAVNDYKWSGPSGTNKRIGANKGYATGVSETGGIKTPTFAGNYGSAESRLYDPGITNDIHNWRAMNVDSTQVPAIREGKQYLDTPHESAAANNKTLYRGTEAVFNELGAEQGVDGYAFQSAVWDGIRNMQDGAPAAWKKWQAGDFQGAIRDAQAAGVFNRAKGVTGAPEPGEISRAMNQPGVKSALAQWGPYLKDPIPPELGISSVSRVYPGEMSKGKAGGPKRGAETLRPASLAFRQGERAVAESYAPVVGGLPSDALARLGVDERGVMPWLAASHRVVEQTPGDYVVHLPAGNADTARYVAATIGDALKTPEMPIHYPDYRAPDIAGFKLVADEATVRRAQQALADDGHVSIRGPTGRSLQVPLHDPESAARIVTTLQRSGIDPATLSDYTGTNERISADAYPRYLAETRARFEPTTAERRGLLERTRGGTPEESAGFQAPGAEAATGGGAAAPAGGGIRGARQRGQSTPAFGLNLGGAALGGYAGNVATPEDASPEERLRNIGLGATAGLLGTHLITRGGAGSLLDRAVAGEHPGFRAPEVGAAERPTLEDQLLQARRQNGAGPPVRGGELPVQGSLADVHSNPHLLNEAAPGATSMTMDERLAHQDMLEQRYQANADRLGAIDEMLRNPGQKPDRPPWGAGWSNDNLITLAKRHNISAFEPNWWEKVGLDVGSGEVREDVSQSGIARGLGRGNTELTPTELRAERNTLVQDQRDLEAAGEQQATAPDNARFVRREQGAADLPFGDTHGPYATEQHGAPPGELATDIVTRNGTKDYGNPLQEGPGQVIGRKGEVTGRGISDVEAAHVGPPSTETQFRMPNLDAMLKGEMPEIRAQIQKAAEDNPQLMDAYQQGRISRDSVMTDLARRVGMSKADWLKTKVGQGFSTPELAALQAAAIDAQGQSQTLARDIVARGGVDALSPEQVAHSLTTLVDNSRLLAVARGGRASAGRSLNILKERLDATMAQGINASNERIAALRVKSQAKAAVDRATKQLEETRNLDAEQKTAVASARSKGAPKNIIDQIADAYDQLDRYQAMTLHEKADDYNALKKARDEAAAARKAVVREAPQELLSALKAELAAERDNFAKRKNTWETMAFWDSKANENVVAKRRAFRGGLYIEQFRKSAELAVKEADQQATRAFDLETRRRTVQNAKASALLESIGGQTPSRELLDNYVRAINSDDPMVAAKFIKGLQDPGWWGKATILRLAGLLSSTATHMANSVGNITQVPLELATHAAVVPIDWGRAKVTGGERQAYMAELGPMASSWGGGLLSALPDAIKVLQTGISPQDAAQIARGKLGRPGFASGSGKLDAAVEMPLRALQAEDQLFRGGAFAMQAKRVATNYATKEGFSGPQLAGRADNIIANLESYPDLYTQAEAATRRMLFQENRTIPMPTTMGKTMGSDIARGAVSQVLPFVKTPGNITAQGFGLSPFGAAGVVEALANRRNLRLEQLGQQTLLTEQRVARTAIGTAIMGSFMALGYGAFTNGKSMLTGAYDPAEASTHPQGYREWSMATTDPVSGNTYYIPFQNFGAAGAPMAMAAILTDAQRRGKSIIDGDEAVRASTAIGQYILDNTFLQGLSDTVNVLHDPSRYAPKFVESLVASYGPYSAMGRQIQRSMGVASRNPREGFQGLVDAMEANYPGASGNVPEATTPLGEPRTQGISGIAAFALPVRADISRDEPTLAALRAAGVSIPAEAKAVNVGNGWSIDLTEQEQDQVKRARGQYIRDQVARVQDLPMYKNGDVSVRNQVLSQAVSNASQTADVLFVRSLPQSQLQARAVRRTVATPYTIAEAS